MYRSIDVYDPKRKVIELRSARRHHTFNGKHGWRRNYRNAKSRYTSDTDKTYGRLNQLERIFLIQSVSVSELNQRLDTDETLAYGDIAYDTDVLNKDTAKILKSYGLNPGILEEYSLEDAIKIQTRLGKEGLKLDGMVASGIFIMGERSGKLYFVDHKVEALFGEDRKLTAEEFFNA
ncbi:hypothetical protein J4480_06900, partial [Candidatus Woesearchaeota archaeon]|nr:hypothetical protein [Candidatus Woesearchaeota archaeon]